MLFMCFSLFSGKRGRKHGSRKHARHHSWGSRVSDGWGSSDSYHYSRDSNSWGSQTVPSTTSAPSPSAPLPESFSLAPNILWDALEWEQNGIVPHFVEDLNLETFEEQLPLGFQPYRNIEPSDWPEDHIDHGYTTDIFAYTSKNGGGVEHIYHKTKGNVAKAAFSQVWNQNEDGLYVRITGPAQYRDAFFQEWDADNFVHPVYSNAKMVTAATFMAAVIDTGLTTLDTPLKQLLPDIFGPDSNAVQGADVTPRMIMSHTSGLAPIDSLLTTDVCFADSPLSLLYFKYNGTMTIEDCMTWLSTNPAAKDAEPLETRRYANSPFNILAVVVQRLTGRTWEEAFQEYIAEPLGMLNSTYICNDVRYASIAMSTLHNPKLANGLCSTAKDFAKFVKFLFEFTLPSRHSGVAATGILSRKSALTMMTRQDGQADQTRYMYSEEEGSSFIDCGRCMNGLYIPKDVSQSTDSSYSSYCYIAGPPAVSGVHSSFGYGQGLTIQHGSKTKFFAHGASNGQYMIMAPGRYVVLFNTQYSTLFPGYSVQRAVDLLEQANVFTVSYHGHSFNLTNCPASSERPDWTPDYRYFDKGYERYNYTIV